MSKRCFFGAAILLCCLMATNAGALKRLGPGDTVPDVSLVTADSRVVPLSQLLPERGAVVVFWAAWNPRSPETLSYLAELYPRYEEHGLVVLPVNVEREGATREDMGSYAATFGSWGLPWSTYFDPRLDAFDAVGVISLPTTLYLARDLKIIGGYPGFPGEAQDALPLLIEKGLGIWNPDVEVRSPIELRYEPRSGAGAVFQMGRLMVRRGQRKKAEQHLAKAATLDPEYPEPVAALAYLAHLAGDSGGAETALDVLKAKSAGDARFREAYGLALLSMGRKEDARAVLEPLGELEAPHVKGLLGIALIEVLEADVPSAERLLARLHAWPMDGIPMEIDVSAYVDPDAPPEQRWSDPDKIMLWLLELN